MEGSVSDMVKPLAALEKSSPSQVPSMSLGLYILFTSIGRINRVSGIQGVSTLPPQVHMTSQ